MFLLIIDYYILIVIMLIDIFYYRVCYFIIRYIVELISVHIMLLSVLPTIPM